MDEGTHLLSGLIIALFFGLGDFNSYFVLWAVLGSILPDVIGEPFYQLARFKKGKKIKIIYDQDVSDSIKDFGKSYYSYPYYFCHSLFPIVFFSVFNLPLIFILSLFFHIILDVFSHSKNTGGMMLLWPFIKKRIGSKQDWWNWKIFKGKNVLYFNLVSWSLFLLVYLIIFLIQKT